MSQKAQKHTSDLLKKVLKENSDNDEISLRTISGKFGKRGFGNALLIFALPNLAPISFIPGLSLLISIPIAFFAVQMILFRKKPWLPAFIANKKIPFEKFSQMVNKSMPSLKRIEAFLKPRWQFMQSPILVAFTGLVILCLFVIFLLPIPFSNSLVAFFIVLISLGIVEKDGLFIVLGYICTFIYFLILYLFIFRFIKAVVLSLLT